MRALETLEVTTDKYASILYPMVESCFSENFLKASNGHSTSSASVDAKERLSNLMQSIKTEVGDLEVPRYVQVTKENLSNCTIHTFVDGRQDAYAAVVFLRIEKEDQTEVFFPTSKARVSLLRGATILRMELLAAVIGTRLTNSVIKALTMGEYQEILLE
ncbi:uncharacterized protein TNCV_5094981 [Trichonephila clavipes]|nr:uncharacterized protein TNCV_5094981 [Trichonephila clavipes]